MALAGFARNAPERRSVTMGNDEALQRKHRRLQSTCPSREKLRERIPVEHRLAHISNCQGPRARYRGTRLNNFALRRLAALQNLEPIARKVAGGAAPPMLRRAA